MASNNAQAVQAAPKPSILKAALLFSKQVPFVKDGVERKIYVGTCLIDNGETIELVSQGPFEGTAVFYKMVGVGEEMWKGRVATEPTNVFLGCATSAAIKDVNVTLAAMAELSF